MNVKGNAMMRIVTLSPIIAAAVFLLFSLAGSVNNLLIALALAIPVAAIVVGAAAGLMPLMVKLLKDKIETAEKDKRMMLSYGAATPIYLVGLLLPILFLAGVKPLLPEDCSITIAYLGGLGLAGAVLGWMWSKPKPTAATSN